MPDPDEGVAPDGTIRTGVRRSRVPAAFEPVLADAVRAIGRGASLYVYGSVANGTARAGSSDVDLLGVGLTDAGRLAAQLSERYAGVCRGVEIAAASAADLVGEGDEAYGNRVFLRHYCVHLAGSDPAADLPAYPADAHAARGFNGDLGRHLMRWRTSLAADPGSAGRLGVVVARKTLLALGGLVSVHDRTWTTDRSRAVRRWSEIEPALALDLARLEAWVAPAAGPDSDEVAAAIAEGGIVPAIVARFRRDVGLWPD